MPSHQPHSPKWLKYIDAGFSIATDTDLVSLNDELDFTFDEIADVLQAVYIEEVLS